MKLWNVGSASESAPLKRFGGGGCVSQLNGAKKMFTKAELELDHRV